MQLKNKTIFIISYEDWGGMFMSKHHYAIELAKNNSVYFINHPELNNQLRRGEINIGETEFPNLWAVNHRMLHPYFLKYKWLKLYNFLTGIHISRIVKKIDKNPDLVWLFDIGNSLPLKYFPSSGKKIYMPVDGPYNSDEEKEAPKSAELILSVTDDILLQYKHLNLPMLNINHGVSEIFINEHPHEKRNSTIKIGYAGSLLRFDLDMPMFIKLISENKDKIFEFWGECDFEKSNVHNPLDVSSDTKDFLKFLSDSKNVILHGAVNPEKLAEGLKTMDVLLILYKPDSDNTRNSHKILEYLAAGNSVIASYMSYYVGRDNLIDMTTTNLSNLEIPEIFNKVTNNLLENNSLERVNKRIQFAKQFTYKNQIKKIESMLNNKI